MLLATKKHVIQLVGCLAGPTDSMQHMILDKHRSSLPVAAAYHSCSLLLLTVFSFGGSGQLLCKAKQNKKPSKRHGFCMIMNFCGSLGNGCCPQFGSGSVFGESDDSVCLSLPRQPYKNSHSGWLMHTNMQYSQFSGNVAKKALDRKRLSWLYEEMTNCDGRSICWTTWL